MYICHMKIINFKRLCVSFMESEIEKFTSYVYFCLSFFMSVHPPRFWSYHLNIPRHEIMTFSRLRIGYNWEPDQLFYVF